MTIPSKPLPVFQRGRQLIDGADLNKLSDLLGNGVVTIVGSAANNKATAVPITNTLAVLLSSGAAKSYLLPKGYPGLRVVVLPDGGSASDIYANGDDTINNAPSTAATSIPSGTLTALYCMKESNGVASWYVLETP